MAMRCILLVLLILAGPLETSFAGETKTSKERLSGKASDEQRVDNCRVPADRRGAKQRPDCKSPAPSNTPTSK
jgi:hypothetical protein